MVIILPLNIVNGGKLDKKVEFYSLTMFAESGSVGTIAEGSGVSLMPRNEMGACRFPQEIEGSDVT